MKRILIFILLVLASIPLQAQQQKVFKSLTVGNRFVYVYYSVMRTFTPKDTIYRYYEDVVRDTIINGKKYAVVFSSFDNSIHFERSDENSLYFWRDHHEELVHSLNFKQDDSVRFSFLGFNNNLQQAFTVIRPERGTNPQTGNARLVYSMNYHWNNLSSDDVLVSYAQPRGIIQLDYYSNSPRSGPSREVTRIFQGGIIDGVVVQDTNSTRRVIVGVNGEEIPIGRSIATLSQPNPFTESVDFSYALPAAAQNVELRIYSSSGTILGVLRRGAQGTGKHTIDWNGKAGDGADVPAGAYFVALYVDGRKQSETKVIKMK